MQIGSMRHLEAGIIVPIVTSTDHPEHIIARYVTAAYWREITIVILRGFA